MATTTPPRPNMHRYRAASTLLPVYRADAKPVVIVTPAVTTAADPTAMRQQHTGLLHARANPCNAEQLLCEHALACCADKPLVDLLKGLLRQEDAHLAATQGDCC